MIRIISNDLTYDYCIIGNELKNNYVDIIKFKRKTKKKRKLNAEIKDMLQLTDIQYDELNKKYSGYEIIPFMHNDLFRFAFNNNLINKEMIIQYMEIYKLDNNNYLVRDRNGIYSHIIMNKGHILYVKDLYCSNCTVIGNIIICDNRIYNYKSKTFSHNFDEISLFDVRKINNRYIECAMATIIVKCEFSDVSASEEINFYIDTNGKAITPIETSVGTFNVNNSKELAEVRRKVYNGLRKSNYVHRAYLKTKKM